MKSYANQIINKHIKNGTIKEVEEDLGWKEVRNMVLGLIVILGIIFFVVFSIYTGYGK